MYFACIIDCMFLKSMTMSRGKKLHEDDEEIKSGEDDVILSDKIKNLSEYEIRKIHRIAENKKRLQKHYATITAK